MVSGLNDLLLCCMSWEKSQNIDRRPERKRRQDRLIETGTVSAAWRKMAFVLV